MNIKYKTLQDYIDNANEIHNGFYDYSKTEKVASKDKTIIICPLHGEFQQRLICHVNGHGCPICRFTKMGKSKRKTNEDFLNEAKEVHKGFYKYKTEYVRGHDKMTIECPIHGDFKQTPSSHLQGVGCPKCGSLRGRNVPEHEKYNDKPTTLYYVKMGKYYKIGLTQSNIEKRFRYENIEYNVIFEKRYENGIDALKIEQSILDKTKEFSISEEISPIKYGYTEIRSKDIYEIVLECINNS